MLQSILVYNAVFLLCLVYGQSLAFDAEGNIIKAEGFDEKPLDFLKLWLPKSLVKTNLTVLKV